MVKAPERGEQIWLTFTPQPRPESRDGNSQMMGLVQCWAHPQGGGCHHLPIEACQLGAVAVQRHRKVQDITSTEAEGWIQKQLSCLTEAIAFERAQFNTALQQALELFPSRLRALWVSVISQSLLIRGSWHCANQSRA